MQASSIREEVDPGHGQLWQDIQLFVGLLGDWDRDGDGGSEESMATRITGIPACFHTPQRRHLLRWVVEPLALS